MSDHDTIVITAPLGTKARWVQRSQAHGQKLSDWIRQAIDSPSNKTMEEPCTTCGSRAITFDRGDWLCAMCGVVR